MNTRPLYRSLIATIALMISVLATPACAAPRGRVYVRVRPPAPIVEARVVSPGPGYVWVSGYHNWNGRAYVWVPGRYERPPRPRSVWVPAHWQHERHGWYLVEGRWR
jgi:hypothetical protein